MLVTVVLISVNVLQPAMAQSTNKYEGKYTVKVGDQAVYKYSNLYHMSPYYYNGMTFIETINKINSSLSLDGQNITHIYAQSTLIFQNGTNSSWIEAVDDQFVFPSFQTKQDVLSYTNSINPNPFIGYKIELKVDNNYVTLKSIRTHFVNYFRIWKYNWHSGWLQSYTQTYYEDSSNTTLQSRLHYSRVDNSNSTFFDQNLPLIFGLSAISIVTITVFFTTIEYRRYSKTNKKLSIFKYLKEKTSRKNENNSPQLNINIDKALKTIEDILEEEK